ncbi:MAG: hypothetical protein ACYDAN_12765 [Candidatus Limnocylindrales bacterium]
MCDTFALVFVAAGGATMARVTDGAVSTAARAVAPGLSKDREAAQGGGD